MSRISNTLVTATAAAALSLTVAATPALAASHQPAKTPHLVKTHLTLHATKQKAAKGTKFKASVIAKLRAHKAPLAGENVELFQRTKGAVKWTDTGTGATTSTDGTAAFAFVQSATKEQYRVVFAGDATYHASHSGVITIKRIKAVKPTS